MFRSMMTPRLWAAACVMALLQACGGGGGGSDGPSRPTWEVASIGPGGGYSLHHVAYGNGRFVALGNNGIGPNANVNGSSSAVSTSTNDGATWTAQLLALTLNPHDFPPSLNAIEFGADRFVAVSSQGDIVTSVDGQAWTTAVWKAQYEGGPFQAVGWPGLRLREPPASWLNRTT